MKVAKVYYTGPGMSKMRRGPTDTYYRMKKGQLGAPDQPAAIRNVEDALFFAGQDNIRVEWTALGRLVRLSQELDAPADDIDAMLSEMVYQDKQKLASALGLKAGGKEDELEERLRPEIERLQETMEVNY